MAFKLLNDTQIYILMKMLIQELQQQLKNLSIFKEFQQLQH